MVCTLERELAVDSVSGLFLITIVVCANSALGFSRSGAGGGQRARAAWYLTLYLLLVAALAGWLSERFV